MTQLHLPFRNNRVSLESYFREATGKKISLVITDNTSTMLSVRNNGRSVDIRLQRMFLSADETVLDEIARYIENHKGKTPLVSRFINEHRHCVRENKPRRVNLKTKGKHFNLASIYDAVNNEYFEGRISATITWGVNRSKRLAARRTLGSYSPDRNLIRVNPILDARRVPKYFVEFIVYHEMLHADMGVKKKGRIHTGEFKKREQLFSRYDRAVAWEQSRW